METYTGLTYKCRPIKQRYNEQNNDMQNPGNRIKTKLSSHVWAIKDSGTDHEVRWRILDRATTYENMQSLSKGKIFYNVQERKQNP